MFGAPAATSGGFLAAFGKKANAEEEKQKNKRKAEDYDSDDETEEQWEKRDKEEQAAKRKKIEDAAKGASGFVLGGDQQPAKAPETPLGAGNLFSKAPPATAPSKSSLFSQTPAGEQPTNNMFGSKTPAATSSANIFGAFKAAEKPATTNVNNTQDEGDNTWKPNTPIKFGSSTTTNQESTTPAAPPPKFGNLFGPASQASAIGSKPGLLNVPATKASIGFNFGGQPGSLGTSRATTPGVTTDGEGASTAGEGEDEEATQNDPQLEDQTALLPEEKEKEELLFSVAVAKASKWDEKKDAETGNVANGWVEKGKGPLYILKNKETGVTRVLLKIKPLGKAAMNFAVLPGMEYIVLKGGKFVQGTFVDHMAYRDPGKPSRWLMQVGKKEDADEIARVLMEARPQEQSVVGDDDEDEEV
jgi:hypothetical protein